MGEVRDLAEKAWRGDLADTQVHPGMALVALEEIAPGLAFMSGFGNVAVLSTDEGLVFVDTSSAFHAAKLFSKVRRWSPSRVHTAVYTHGHVDHVFGLVPFEEEARANRWPSTCVVAHRACPERFDRYKLTNGYNGVINQRQFGFAQPFFPSDFRYPDRVLDDAGASIAVGGVTVELRHDRGETDDHLWAWIPSQRAIYTGDLFIWAAPNCGNPQKVQRYPREWARALRKMRDLDAAQLMPGHGPPIFGEERVREALSGSIELLDTILEQTLRLMNDGATLDDVLAGVSFPDHLLARPWLRPTYDDPTFIVRNLWRLYGGWYDGNPAHLKPPRERELGAEIAALAGGARALAERAVRVGADGRLTLACQLVEHAFAADPTDARVRAVRADLYRARAKEETSLMAKGIYGAAVRDSEGETKPG
ncbi:MAG: alkyl sulfatase dimerization domain-containing protein [Alphaproteobacteria bacterium]